MNNNSRINNSRMQYELEQKKKHKSNLLTFERFLFCLLLLFCHVEAFVLPTFKTIPTRTATFVAPARSLPSQQQSVQPLYSNSNYYRRNRYSLPFLSRPPATTRLHARFTEGESDWFRLFQRNDEDRRTNEEEDHVIPEPADAFPMPKRYKRSQRIKARFDKLFEGMPGMNDIIGSSSNDDEDDDDDNAENQSKSVSTSKSSSRNTSSKTRQQQRKRPSKSTRDNNGDNADDWFEPTKKQIIQSYDDMQDQMLEQLNNQRQVDPNAVPERAEALIKSVLKQELARELKETRERLGEERLAEYEVTEKERVDNQDLSQISFADTGLQKLIDESESAYQQQQSLQAEIDDFARYEKEAKAKIKRKIINESVDDNNKENYENDHQESSVVMPAPGDDLDQWALDRLNEMANARKNADSQEVLDILEENAQELRNNIAKEIAKREQRGAAAATNGQDTLKDWQMYRAIATRLAELEADSTSTSNNKKKYTEQQQEDRITKTLNSWKDYVQLEETIRKSSGLSRGPRLPFEWQESWDQNANDNSNNKEPTKDVRSKAQIRQDINRMSIKALEDLIEKSDSSRREKLQKELDFLKSTLEANDYLDIDVVEDELASVGNGNAAVDLTGVLNYYSDERTPSDARTTTTTSSTKSSSSSMSPQLTTNTRYNDFTEEDIIEPKRPSRPKTPFFEEFIDDSNDIEYKAKSPPPPRTPFFDDNVDDTSEIFSPKDSKLGDAEDQKLNAMFRKAGARTQQEQDVLKSQWEEYKKLEKLKRDASGLSSTSSVSSDDVDLQSTPSLNTTKYNITEVMQNDGDFDASKVLAAIGPRPERKKRKTNGVENVPAAKTKDEPSIEKETTEEKEIVDSMYRSIAAVGGGRYKDDPDQKIVQQQKFEELMRKEKEMRATLDDAIEEKSVDAEKYASSVDDPEFAKELIASLGPRPQVRRSRAYTGKYSSDSTGTRTSDKADIDDAIDVDDDDDDDDEEEVENVDDEEEEDEDDDDLSSRGSKDSRDFFAGYDDASVPDWLLKERESAKKPTRRKRFLNGEDIDEVFEDDKYDHNMRQLAEYERRRAGKEDRQMGIDISDVLRTNTDDYADYKYDTNYERAKQTSLWGIESFAARKRNLLEYRELDVLELNSLMDHKDSVYSTGVSQYTPRINKPFKEFGAIFRLEGVLVDITGLQMLAWQKVAEKFNYKSPVLEDVRLAAVCRPEVAAREVFGWTDDFIQCGHIAVAHRQAMKEVFDTWTVANKIEQKSLSANTSPQGSLAIGEELFASPPAQNTKTAAQSEDEMIESIYNAWMQTAQVFGYHIQNEEDVFRAMTLSPDIAVRQVFKWTTNPLEVDEISRHYRKSLQVATTGVSLPTKQDKEVKKDTNVSNKGNTNVERSMSASQMMEVHYQAWLHVANMFSFDKPLEEEVMAAFVINDPEIAVRDGFGWTDDDETVTRVAGEFRNKVREILHGNVATSSDTAEKTLPTEVEAEEKAPEDISPSDDEIFEMVSRAWASTATAFGFPLPTKEQVKIAMNVDIEQAVLRILQWTDGYDKIDEIATTLDNEFEKESNALIEKYNLTLSEDAIIVETASPDSEIETKATISADELFKVSFDAWTAVAKRLNVDMPDEEQIQFALTVGPEEAIITGFEWATEQNRVIEILHMYREELGKRRPEWQKNSIDNTNTSRDKEEEPLVKFLPGAHKWIMSLTDVEMQVGVISHLERDQVAILLEQAGLADVFPPERRVTATDGYNRDTYQMLGAALRVERRPDHCVVFDSSPYSSVAAHDVEMRSVAMINPYPRYELLSADTTAASFDELTAMNIRRLFGERVYDQPMMDMQQAQPATQKKQKTKFFWDDD